MQRWKFGKFSAQHSNQIAAVSPVVYGGLHALQKGECSATTGPLIVGKRIGFESACRRFQTFGVEFNSSLQLFYVIQLFQTVLPW